MSKMLGSSQPNTTNPAAAAAPVTNYKDAQGRMTLGASNMVGPNNDIADPTKKKGMDWKKLIQSGLQGMGEDQQDPMAVLNQIQQQAAQSQGRVY